MAKTSCDWIVERLPWWANETLEEGEAERVAAHLEECAACGRELAATRQAMALYAAHLPIEALLDLAEGGAGEAAEGELAGGVSRAAAQAHLGHCHACRDELALLRESRAATLAGADEPGARLAAFPGRRDAAPRRRFDPRRLALAASLLAAVVSAGGWFLTDQVADERLAEMERRLAAARAERPEPGSPPAGVPADGPATSQGTAEWEEEIEALRRERDRLLAELEAERRPAPSGERVAALVGPGTGWDVRSVVLRGSPERPEAPADTVDARAASTYSYFVTGVGDRPLRLVVEDEFGRTLYETAAASQYDGGELGRHVTFTVPLAALPEGTFPVRLLSGDEELGTRVLRVER